MLAVLGVAEAELILATADAIAAEDGKAALEVSERLARSGRDVTQFGRDVLAHLRQLLVIRTVGDVPDAFSVTAADPERLRTQAEQLSDLALVRAIDVIAAALAAVKEGDEPRMTLELALLRAARPAARPDQAGPAPAARAARGALGAAWAPPASTASSRTGGTAAQARRVTPRRRPGRAPPMPSADANRRRRRTRRSGRRGRGGRGAGRSRAGRCAVARRPGSGSRIRVRASLHGLRRRAAGALDVEGRR